MELTGDTDNCDAYHRLGKVNLVVTTPEKWDSITRRSSMFKVIERLRLMMIDEVSCSADFVYLQVHILHEERGATLEVVVSRMKYPGHRTRFVAVSASVCASHLD